MYKFKYTCNVKLFLMENELMITHDYELFYSFILY